MTKMNKQIFRLRRQHLALSLQGDSSYYGISYNDPSVSLLTCPLSNTTVQQRLTTQITIK